MYSIPCHITNYHRSSMQHCSKTKNANKNFSTHRSNIQLDDSSSSTTEYHTFTLYQKLNAYWWYIIICSVVERPLTSLRALNLCQSLLFFFFCLWYLQDCQADRHQIFQENGKWSAIEKLRFWFLNSFGNGGGRFRKVTYTLDPASQNTTW